MAQDKQARLHVLMDANSQGTLEEAQRVELEALVTQGQRLSVRKAQAAALLTERGYRVTREAWPRRMSNVSWAAIVRLVHERAHNCCEYCQTCRDTIGQAMHVEHIDPNGGDDPENLCLACPTCNLSKARLPRPWIRSWACPCPCFIPASSSGRSISGGSRTRDGCRA